MPLFARHDFEILHASHLRFPAGWTTRKHAHDDAYEMILILEGEIETRIRGEVLRGHAGSVFVYPRGMPHEERAVDGPLHMLLVVWRESSPTRVPADWPLISNDNRGRIRELAHWLHELQPGDASTLSALLHCALFEFERGAVASSDDPISRVLRHIERNFFRKLALSDLAKIAHKSPFHFARLFRERTGLPPMRYLRQVRVEAAKTLLVTSPLPLRAIAPMVGLVDEFHLSRVICNVTGKPPSSLRLSPVKAPKIS